MQHIPEDSSAHTCMGWCRGAGTRIIMSSTPGTLNEPASGSVPAVHHASLLALRHVSLVVVHFVSVVAIHDVSLLAVLY